MSVRFDRPNLTEAEFQAMVVDLARACGWRTNHVRRSIGKGRKWTTATTVVGWPDLTLYRPKTGELLWAELKSATGKVSAEQEAVLADLRACGQEVHVWRPADLDRIAARLRRAFGPVPRRVA